MDCIGQIGNYSYGIYLLHGLLVTTAAAWVDSVFELASIYEALPFALLFFLYMALLGRISFTFIEQPFLKRRQTYFREETTVPTPAMRLRLQAAPSLAEPLCCP